MFYLKKIIVVGLQGREMFDDIFIGFDTIPACDGHAMMAIAVLC